MTEYVKDVPEKPEVLIGIVFTFMQTVSLAKTFDSVFENARTRLLRQKIWYQSHALMWRRALGQFHFLCDFFRLTACWRRLIEKGDEKREKILKDMTHYYIRKYALLYSRRR